MKRNICLAALVSLVILPMQAQQDTLYVNGIVTDAATHKVLLGVRVKSGNYTALTDEEGKFHVRVPSRGAEITVSNFGYDLRTVGIRGKKTVNVEIYSTHFTKGNAYAANYTNLTAVTADEIIATQLGGDVRSTTRSGEIGSGSDLLIRGVHSLYGNTQPLFVVDGVVWDNELHGTSAIQGYRYNPLQTIDPNDIEKITVLKNASTLYGSKGANGAILIQTKRSRSFSTKIGVDLSYGFSLKPNLPDVMNASEYRTYMSEIMKDAGLSKSTLSNLENTLLNEDPTSIYYNKYHNSHDWYDEVYRTGNTQHYGINVQGGDNIAVYMISLGYTRGNQTVKGTDFSRLNTRINSDIHVLPTVDIATSLYFTHTTRNLLDDGVNERTSPTYVASIKSPMLMGYKWKNDGSALTSTLDDVDELGMANPNALISNEKGLNKQYRFGVNITPEWHITPNLSVKDVFSYQLDNAKEHAFSPSTGVPSYQLNGITITDAIADQTISQNSLQNDLSICYHHLFAQQHDVTVNGGWRLLSNRYKNTYAVGYNTSNDELTNLTGSLTSQSVTGLNDVWNSSNMYLSAQYEYQKRYQVWTTLSLDGSSRFGTDTEDGFRLFNGTYGFFPSAGLAWTVSNEKFMQYLPVVSYLQLHTSYGLTGNDDLGTTGVSSYLSPVNYLGNAYGLVLSHVANDKLQWETTRKWDGGIELGLFKDRLCLSFDLFHHLTSNLLTLRETDLVSGSDPCLVNDGKLKNTGYEFGVSIKAVNTNKMKWNVALSGSHATTKIESLDNTTTYSNGLTGFTTDVLGGQVITAIGHGSSEFYGYKTLGVFSSDAEASTADNGNGYLKMRNEDTSVSLFKAGDVHFADLNGDGYIDDNDKTIIGNPNPDLTGSITNHFGIGRFAVDINFTYSFGGDLYNYQRQMLESMSDFSNQSSAVTNRWKMEGQVTDMPKATFGDPMQNSRFSDRWIEDGSYLKFKQVRISYQLPIKSTFIDGITLWAAANNLYTWTKYLGSDPETSYSSSVFYQGVDNGLLANGRSFHFGIKLNL